MDPKIYGSVALNKPHVFVIYLTFVPYIFDTFRNNNDHIFKSKTLFYAILLELKTKNTIGRVLELTGSKY